MKKKKIHYGVADIIDLACGISCRYSKKCKECGHVKFEEFRKVTFNKQKVTCKRCRKSKVFKEKDRKK